MSAGFLPCPICGMELSEHNLHYFDSEGEITDFDHVRDYDDFANPVNMCLKEVWDDLEDTEKKYLSEDYEACVEQVEYIALQCSCGYSFCTLRDDTRFPERGWLDGFKEKANQRPTITGCHSELRPDIQKVYDLEELIDTRKDVLRLRNLACLHSSRDCYSVSCGDREAFKDGMARIFDIADGWFKVLDARLEEERQSTEYGFYIPPCLDDIIRIGIERMTPEEKDAALHAVKAEHEDLVGKGRCPDQLSGILDTLHKDRLRRNAQKWIDDKGGFHMSMFNSIKEGSWRVWSEKDPRFDCSGRGYVGGFECPSEAEAAIERKEKELGCERPDDLHFSYMKDRRGTTNDQSSRVLGKSIRRQGESPEDQMEGAGPDEGRQRGRVLHRTYEIQRLSESPRGDQMYLDV